MAGESDDLHNERLFSGLGVQWLRRAYRHKSLTALRFLSCDTGQKQGRVCRHDWTENLRLRVANVSISVSSISLVTFEKVPRPLSVGGFLGERLDTLRIERSPKPLCFTRRLN